MGSELAGDCVSCGQPLVLCPQCGGDDNWVDGLGNFDEFWICQKEECENYQFCCGC